MNNSKGILVIGELSEGKLVSITKEMLGIARKLADESQQDVSCLLANESVQQTPQEAIAFGADKVYTAEDPALKSGGIYVYLQIVEKLIADISPWAVIMGQTYLGTRLSPRLAAKLGVNLTTDCVDLKLDPDKKAIIATRPIYGGNVFAELSSDLIPHLVAVRSKAMSPIEQDSSRKGEVTSLKAEIDQSVIKTKIVKSVKEEVTGVKLEDAFVIVAGGRGIGGAEPFKTTLQDLANLFPSAATGASRPPADDGWVPEAKHIGLTGRIVAPDIYFAIGISGASQHMAGCTGSKTVVAINKDPEANIFKLANYGVVGKYEEVLPAFTEKLKSLLAE
jgi:electron transfer flavoprotein alpha subunit